MDPQKLNEVASHPLQTSFWADFRRSWGNEILETQYGIITLHKIPFTNFRVGIFEKGPLPTEEMIQDLKSLGRQHSVIFFKLEPNVTKILGKENGFESLINLIKSSGLIRGKRLFTPTTFWIDLEKSEEDLLKSFSGKTRYNIRVAEKNGVVIKEDNSDIAFERYLKLTKETSIRQNFFAHSEKYHRLMWKTLHTEMVDMGIDPIAHLFTAKYKPENKEEQIITTWILFVWKDFLYYPYGASTEEYKNTMANNLMMWEAIKFGKKMNLKTFDLWGREEGKGFTRFKEGYNPKVVEFLGTWDLVISKPLYYLYNKADAIRWLALKTKAKFKSIFLK